MRKIVIEKGTETVFLRLPMSLAERMYAQMNRLNVNKAAVMKIALVEWLEKQEGGNTKEDMV